MPGTAQDREDAGEEEDARVRREEEERRGRPLRQAPPHFDAAAAIADPAFMNVVLRGIMSQLPAFQVPPAPQPQAPVARVYVTKIPRVTNKSAFQTEYWKKEENYLAFGRHNWDQWVDNIVRSLGLVSPLDRWIEHVWAI
jgi:hypothetical protein